jgi:putative cardiolipin synthase
LLLLAAVLAGCGHLPALESRPMSTAIEVPLGQPLSDAVAAVVATRPGLTGVHLLREGLGAFAARMALIDAASASLDVQYYIWRNDVTGRLLLDALRRAADRGVRVRLLLDDNNTAGLDPTLAALDAHPRIEVRLFNPFRQRSFRTLGYLTEFGRLNRRMHNKSLTGDGVATILGGRNVGDEYFEATEDIGFVDLDVLVVGPVVADVATSFDDYWRSDSAYAAASFLPAATDEGLEATQALGRTVMAEPEAVRYVAAARDAPVIRDLRAQSLSFEWAPARLVVDDPAKGLGKADPGSLLLGKLDAAIGAPVTRELAIVSPYFVPRREGAALLEGYARRGVRVRVLTNSLEATDVVAVHSGYARHRKALIQAGVGIHELKRTVGRSQAASMTGFSGSSGSSLHAKTFAVDGRHIFVGSFNFDPRSALLNTEMGLVIDSGKLADVLSAAFDSVIPAAAYEVGLAPDGKLEWRERSGGGVVRHDHEPGTGVMRRIAVKLMSVLPIEGLL